MFFVTKSNLVTLSLIEPLFTRSLAEQRAFTIRERFVLIQKIKAKYYEKNA